MSHRLIIVGDTHCQFDVLEEIVASELDRDPNVVAVLHCGDIGIYDADSAGRLSKRELQLIEKHRNPVELCFPYLSGERRLPVPLVGLPGNHEDFELVAELEEGRRTLPGFDLFTPGQRRQFRVGGTEVSVVGLGRILPDEISSRSRGKAKYITEDSVERTRKAARRGRPDILLLHEPPRLEVVGERRRTFGSSALLDLVRDVAPQMAVFGHMHFEVTATIGSTAIYGLGYGVRGRYAVVDEGLSFTFRALDGESERPMTALNAAPGG